jgi:hypothetical protein
LIFGLGGVGLRVGIGAALTRFQPWTATTDDLNAWAHNPHRRADADPEPDTTEPEDQRSGPAP